MINPSQPSVINGISLLTRKGDYKTRYSFEERLQLLDCSEEEFNLFMDIFARKLTPYAKARDQPRNWTTPGGMLTRNDVARHLLRDRIPGPSIIWIATRAWETTKWMGIDVDLGSGKRDFKERRQQVRRALRGMGIQNDSVLYSPTPSGGCHYRVFFSQHIDTSHIRSLFKPFGIEHQNGRFELFPSTDQAMRLPFGHIPGRNCNDDEWMHFVRAHATGTFPTVDADAIYERYHQKKRSVLRAAAVPSAEIRRQVSATGGAVIEEDQSSDTREPPVRQNQVPSARRNDVPSPLSPDDPQLAEYRRIIFSSQSNFADVSRLIEMGIMEYGTRVAASIKVAWHLIFARLLPRDVALSELLTWVMRTGRTTSKDVAADISKGTNYVEQQVTHLVDWLVERRTSTHSRIGPAEDQPDWPRFHLKELQHIAEKIACVEVSKRFEVFEFAVRVLQFAKRYGEPQHDPAGWTARISSTLMRGWPGCSGLTYVRRRTAIEEVGLLRMTREKKQTNNRTGRSRTYLMICPVIPQERLNLSFAAALELTFQWTNWCDEGTRCRVINDKYRRVTPSSPGDTDEVRKRSTAFLKLASESQEVTNRESCGQSVKVANVQTPRSESNCQLPSSDLQTLTSAPVTANTFPVAVRECVHAEREVARVQFLESLFTRPELTSIDTACGDDASITVMEVGTFHVLGRRYAAFLQRQEGLPPWLITTFQHTGLPKHSKQLMTKFLASAESQRLVSLLLRLEELRLNDGKWLFPREIARRKDTSSNSQIANQPLATA